MDSCGCGSRFIYFDPNKPFDGGSLTTQARKQMREKRFPHTNAEI